MDDEILFTAEQWEAWKASREESGAEEVSALLEPSPAVLH